MLFGELFSLDIIKTGREFSDHEVYHDLVGNSSGFITFVNDMKTYKVEWYKNWSLEESKGKMIYSSPIVIEVWNYTI